MNELNYTSYLLVNVEQVGYYRVLYDDYNWLLIAKELSEGSLDLIPAKSRAMLIDDASVFGAMRIVKLRIVLELIKYLEHEVSQTVVERELVYVSSSCESREKKTRWKRGRKT